MQCALLTNFDQSYSGFVIYIFAVSTIIIKRSIFQINFDGIVLSSRLQQSYKLFKLCAKFYNLRFTNKEIIQGGNTPSQTNMLSEDPSRNRVNPAVCVEISNLQTQKAFGGA